jgi:3-phosphoshikimate 1-carboxyvinyltransferase
LVGGATTIKGDVSSQFLSALLMVGPLARGPLTIHVQGELVSRPYVEMTLSTIRAFGGAVTFDGERCFQFAGGSGYHGARYAIEPDASAASYFFAAAAMTGGRVTVDGLGASSLQGDLRFVDLLRRMGCDVLMTDRSTTVVGAHLKGIDADMRDVSDTVPTLAAVACFASSPTVIRNVAHIRQKESDRVHALATELSKTGLRIEERADGMVIHPGPIQPVAFDTYHDHRMAMALSLIGLRVGGVVIRNPGCVAKTYPDYFADLERLCAGGE